MDKDLILKELNENQKMAVLEKLKPLLIV